ncbi:MAG: hypothetical protein CO140_00575 [Candidatus Moranbacteria bacterium CG_4_9_14_3_um_filter_40_7]|nr:MAG: hypothetical protein COX31_00290 [Candidatus Moranbacteria bacterium CG23_combo_of_CG06-09_8_20_14_all_40_16]PIU80333.1 MAG: hypothetical protein COS71_04045 [Candidatus Moranbacteria bacterium CG06_land_8_20_14_3_00_40_12]PJA88119.1 MAG: hypothetical protein CO140_00575 [Candidatus Moranbacteria bacterium CG_4_9_14_3_um_filter_40_7]
MKKQKIDTRLGVAIIVISVITVATLLWIYEKNPIDIRQSSTNILSIPKTDNHYSNSDYGFSLDLPYTLDKYVIQVSPNTVAKISFLLPATDQKFLQYTGHKLTDTFNILAYPKSEIDTIRKECSMRTSKYISYECTLNDEQPIAENNMYSFYYLKGGVGMGAYPQALEKEEYEKSENALKTFQVMKWLLNFNPNAWHKFIDTKYGFEVEYPNNWRGGSSDIPKINKLNLISIFYEGGPMKNSAFGSIFFGKYDIYNNELTGSIEGNTEILNSKINIVGSTSKFKEIKIEGGRAFYSTVQDTLIPNERTIFIVGKNVIFNGSIQTSSSNMNPQDLSELVDKLSHFKFQ